MKRTIPAFALLCFSLEAEERLAFNRDTRPVLSRTCFACHGPDAAAVKGGLRLDARDLALQGGESGEPAIVPGEPAKSLIVKRITSEDPDDVMPPPEAHMRFSKSDAALLTRWIEEGAEYEGHWAFEAPKKAGFPEETEGISNPIDRFVSSRLKKDGLDF